MAEQTTDPHAGLASQINTDWAKLQQTEKATEEARKAFGKLLLDAKAKVGHGKFSEWIEKNCSITHRTANRYMALVEPEAKGKLDSVSNLTATSTANAPPATTTIIDLLDSRMDRVIKALDKLKKEEGVEAAIEEIEKLKETLDAKEAELTKEKMKTDKKHKGKAVEQHATA
jgi:Protein of unknown function (DUF3102)